MHHQLLYPHLDVVPYWHGTAPVEAGPFPVLDVESGKHLGQVVVTGGELFQQLGPQLLIGRPGCLANDLRPAVALRQKRLARRWAGVTGEGPVD